MKNRLYKLLRDFAREEGLKLTDFRKEILDIGLDLYNKPSLDNPGFSKAETEFPDLHYKLVKDTIDYLKSHPEVMKKVEEKKKELTERISPDFTYIPDLRLNLHIDGLDESVEEGDWIPSTDSTIELLVGTVSVMFGG